MRMTTVHTMAVLEDALAGGYELKFSATRGWLLVSARGGTMRLAAKLVYSATFREKCVPKRALDDARSMRYEHP